MIKWYGEPSYSQLYIRRYNYKMDNTPSFQCERCGYSTNSKFNLIRHLQKKNVCFPTLLNTPPETIINTYKKTLCDDHIPCKYNCGAHFKFESGKYRHQSTCKFASTYKKFDEAEMCKRMNKLEEEIVILKNAESVKNTKKCKNVKMMDQLILACETTWKSRNT
jgi:hypothetical protein